MITTGKFLAFCEKLFVTFLHLFRSVLFSHVYFSKNCHLHALHKIDSNRFNALHWMGKIVFWKVLAIIVWINGAFFVRLDPIRLTADHHWQVLLKRFNGDPEESVVTCWSHPKSVHSNRKIGNCMLTDIQIPIRLINILDISVRFVNGRFVGL